MPSENQNYQPVAPVLRNLLQEFSDGLSVKEICEKTGIAQRSVRPTLKKMADCYIDRWIPGKFRTPPTAIWCIVEVPENCPRPRHQPRRSVQSVGNQLAI
jgi:hypothetical protein